MLTLSHEEFGPNLIPRVLYSMQINAESERSAFIESLMPSVHGLKIE